MNDPAAPAAPPPDAVHARPHGAPSVDARRTSADAGATAVDDGATGDGAGACPDRDTGAKPVQRRRGAALVAAIHEATLAELAEVDEARASAVLETTDWRVKDAVLALRGD